MSAQDREQTILSTAVYRELGGRDHRFELRLGEIRELERLCGSGIGSIWRRMAMLDFKIDDLRETIRLGLVGGGGVTQPEATAIIKYSVDRRPINEYFDLALAIVKACFEGVTPMGKINGADPSGAPAISNPSTNSVAPQDIAPGK